MTARAPDGLLCVDKPVGVSSHDMVLAVRSALGQKRIGHAGTLDPFATGLLVMLVGRATRLLPYLPGDPKVYEATFVFGAETDTEDPLGTVIRTAPMPTRDAVERAIPALTGDIMQVPSSFSAKRVDGQRAYKLARKGKAAVLEPVRIRVDAWDVTAWRETDGHVTECDARITCSAGTYVRALARELGRGAESAAHLGALRRVRSGPFDVKDAHTLAELRERTVVPRAALDAVPHLAQQELSLEEVAAIVRGINIAATVAGDRVALVNAENGVLVALAERRDGRWQPRVVMRPAEEMEAAT